MKAFTVNLDQLLLKIFTLTFFHTILTSNGCEIGRFLERLLKKQKIPGNILYPQCFLPYEKLK